MAEDGSQAFALFLERSLELLAHDAPEHFAAVRARMRGLAVCIGVDGSAPVRVQLDVAPWVGPPAHTEVWVEIDQRDLAAILDGSVSIEAAVDDDQLLLRGELDHLLRFFDALDAWIHGAVRCASMAGLFRDYLAHGETSQGLAVSQVASVAPARAGA